MMDPFGFFDFVALEQHARLVITDSGTVQEESSILHVPNVTIRDVTERPETIETGSNMLTGAMPEELLRAVEIVAETNCDWPVPIEYTEKNVSNTVVKILLQYYHRLY
jgi:UDP-N-acetylglucosamine 2-epimerase (non-hydrolysing)